MSNKPRFLLDEHIPVEIARQLRGSGINVLTVGEIQRLGGKDVDLLRWAADNVRVFVTHDTDLMVIAQTYPEHAGIVWASERHATIGGWVRALRTVHDRETVESMMGQFRIATVR
ncbi:MAG: DUF5615 family PIN-like protein [Anaerolineae bacterium]|nr:DUF5615 family PIN-like protein [Anaerolineae bacterium]